MDSEVIILNGKTYKEVDPTTVEITKEEAAVWFSKNEMEPHQQCEKEFADLEIK